MKNYRKNFFKLLNDDQHFARILLIFIPFLYIAFAIIYRSISLQDPIKLSVRILISSLFLLIFLLSFFSSKIYKNLYEITRLVSYGTILHLLYISYLTNFTLNYIFSLLIVIGVANIIFNADKKLKWYNYIIGAFLIIAVYISENIAVSKFVFIFAFTAIALFSYLLSEIRNNIERKIIFHDKLTGLHNRDFLEEEMKRLDTARQLPISIIVGDMNYLKTINDNFGHDMGDKFIKTAAQVIKDSCREEDIVTRWGGDEFVILLPQTSSNKAQKVIKRINRKAEEISINGIPLSIAFGAATKKNEKQNIDEILKQADKNMYKNKAQ
ncbi:MAG: GGDEF domain-containing protein [Halanaerobiaceae bacterium]